MVTRCSWYASDAACSTCALCTTTPHTLTHAHTRTCSAANMPSVTLARAPCVCGCANATDGLLSTRHALAAHVAARLGPQLVLNKDAWLVVAVRGVRACARGGFVWCDVVWRGTCCTCKCPCSNARTSACAARRTCKACVRVSAHGSLDVHCVAIAACAAGRVV
jgi:hypothetical protein